MNGSVLALASVHAPLQAADMPPRAALTSSFSVSDAGNEVVCPLKNNDGSSCRKRCFGDKRYRSMQEHIRRAHPEYYIPKLPATEESFVTMINTPPSDRPRTAQGGAAPFAPSGQSFDPRLAPPPHAQLLNALGGSVNHYSHYAPAQISPTNDRSGAANSSGAAMAGGGAGNKSSGNSGGSANAAGNHLGSGMRRPSLIPAANAAAALAQLHNSRPDGEWDADHDPFHDNSSSFNYFANQESSSLFNDAGLHDTASNSKPREQLNREALAALTQATYGARSSSLQPLHRNNRVRKSSVTEGVRKAKHERHRSFDQKRLSNDRKALSVEPSMAARLPGGSKWEDLLEAAASATEEGSRDLTPIPQSPHMSQSLYQPPHNNHNFQSYTASPLQNTVMPHSPTEASPTFDDHLQPFPSVESFDNSIHQAQPSQPYQHHHHSSNESSSHSNPFNTYQRHHPHPSQSSGTNFHMHAEGLSSPTSARIGAPGFQPNNQTYGPNSQPAQSPTQVQHYCAGCHRATMLNSSYACTECICGICRDCVEVLMGMGPDRGACPRCRYSGARFKPFMLDLR